jgi:long-subunit acyl-CoA synthetase (AMP-forming)
MLDKSLVHQLAHHAATRPHEPAIHGKDARGAWVTYTWAQYWEAAREVAKGLIALGHQPGECVAIVGANRPEWVIAQFGIMAAKGIAAPSYPTNTVAQVAHILRNSEAAIAIADSKLLADNWREAAAMDDAVKLEHVICMLDAVDPESTALSQLRALGREQPDAVLDARLASLTHDDVCMLIYTSGTTGVSKGVMIDHGGVLDIQAGALDHLPLFLDRDNHPYYVVSYLPLCHVAEQFLTNYLFMRIGGQAWFCPDLDQIRDFLLEVRPTVFAGVPRVWEKFQAVLEGRLAQATGLRRTLAGLAMSTELAAQKQEMRGRPARGLLRTLANRVVLAKIRQALGFDRLELAATAAAPISVGTLEFFASLGIVVTEWYGMSETTGLASGNPPGKVRFGTVGVPLSNVAIRIADDGEILLKGRSNTRGYLRMPDASAELLDSDGWLHTGDLGELSDGYVKITGRKKDILITAGGKNVAPAEMEALISQIVGVGQAVVVGDRQPYLSALLVLDPENLTPLAHAAGVPVAPFAELARNPDVRAHLTRQVELHCNAKVARFQTIKRIAVLPAEFSVAAGELTPTMKVRRAVITEKYAVDIAALYASGSAP